MFGMGWPEIGLIMVVGLLVFGPDRMPEMARQAGQWVRTIKQMAENAKNDLTSEFGDDIAELKAHAIDPRDLVRQQFLDEDLADGARGGRTQLPLQPGEKAPFDSEAT